MTRFSSASVRRAADHVSGAGGHCLDPAQPGVCGDDRGKRLRRLAWHAEQNVGLAEELSEAPFGGVIAVEAQVASMVRGIARWGK